MSETSGFITSQKTISTKVDADFKKLFNRVADYLGLNEEDYGITDVINTTFKKIDEKFNPKASKKEDLIKIEKLENQLKESNEFSKKVEQELEFYAKENKEFSNKIEQLETNIKALNENITEFKSNTAKNSDEYAELLEKNTVLQQKFEEATSQLHGKIELQDNQIILELSEYQEKYLVEIIKDKKFIAFLKKYNSKGKFNNIIDPLIANEKTDITLALKGFFFYSAKLGKHPLIPFDKWAKKFKKQ